MATICSVAWAEVRSSHEWLRVRVLRLFQDYGEFDIDCEKIADAYESEEDKTKIRTSWQLVAEQVEAIFAAHPAKDVEGQTNATRSVDEMSGVKFWQKSLDRVLQDVASKLAPLTLEDSEQLLTAAKAAHPEEKFGLSCAKHLRSIPFIDEYLASFLNADSMDALERKKTDGLVS